MGFAFHYSLTLLKELCWVVFVLKDFVRVILFFARNSGVEHTCSALWMGCG